MAIVLDSIVNMDATTGLVFVVVFLSVYMLLSRTRHSRTTANRKLPPCPPFCLPIVGHLPLLAQRDLLETFTLQRQKLGDIYRLQIGRTTVVVISSYRLLYTAFVKNADIFSDRPHTVFLELCKDNGIILLNGPRWKKQRQIVLKNFRYFCARTTILETIIHKQIHRFRDNVATLDGGAVDPKQLINDVISSVVGELMIGKIFDSDKVKFKSYVKQHDEIVHSTAKAVILDFLPFLRYLPLDLVNHARVEDLYQKTTSFVKGKIGEKLKQSLDEREPRDLMEAYLKSSGSELDEDQVTQTVSDMFAAGLETTVSTLRWALVYLTKYPDVQSRLQQEVDQALPAGTLPSMADKQAMPYVEAFVMELLRHSDVAPVGLLHSVNCDTYLDGYFIPKGTTIIPNIDSVLKDPDSYESPYEFKPERFIGADGKIFKPDTFIPFFFGKRLCVGEQIARTNLMLFLTSLVQAYTVSRPANDQAPVSGALNITYCPSDFKVCFHRRDITHQGRI